MTITETLIASAIMVTISGGVFTLVAPAQRAFQAQPEVSDMLQRMRVGIDTLARDLRMAQEVLPSGAAAITIRLAPLSDPEIVTRTYYLKADTAANAFQLMRRDETQVDLPVVDHVVKLEFEYVGDTEPCDADRLRVRRVRVTLGVQVASASLRGRLLVPDHQVRFDVTPRNLLAGALACSS